MNPQSLFDAFVAATSAKLIPRADKLRCPNLPGDLRLFFERFQAGSFFDVYGNRFEFVFDPFRENLNLFHARHEALPLGGHVGAFRRYDSCYVVATSVSEAVPTEEDPEKLFVGVDLHESHFGWVFFYRTGEHPWEIDSTACYVAESWSQYLAMVIKGEAQLQGASLWSKEHKILSDSDLLDYYTPVV